LKDLQLKNLTSPLTIVAVLPYRNGCKSPATRSPEPHTRSISYLFLYETRHFLLLLLLQAGSVKDPSNAKAQWQRRERRGGEGSAISSIGFIALYMLAL